MTETIEGMIPKPFRKMVKIGVPAVILFIVLLVLGIKTVDFNDADERIVLQSVGGTMSVIDTPGPYMRLFGTPTIYKRVIAVNFTGTPSAKASSKLEPNPRLISGHYDRRSEGCCQI
jgi:hypothetical protein